MVLDIEAEGAEIRERLVDAKRKEDRPAQKICERELTTIKRQKQLLRRVLDEVLRQIIGNDTWALRRLKLYDEERNIDPNVLKSTLREAWKRNKENRTAFHLVTDLLTAVHVGDLIRVDKRAGAGRKWSIIELKSGVVNDALQRLIGAASPDASNEQLEQMATSVSPTADKQVRRMIRQALRQKRVEEIVDTDKGVHPLFDVPIIQHDAPRDTEDYLDSLRELSEALKERDFAATSIQGCIHLLGVRGPYLEQYGIGLVAHHFYHLAHAGVPCLLSGTEAERVSELASAAKLEIHDLLVVNLFASWSISFFQWPMKTENIFDIALGRHRLFAYIDYSALFARASQRGLLLEVIPKDLKGIKGEARDHIGTMSSPLPGQSNASGLRARNAQGQEVIFMSGFVVRLLAEHMLPDFWLEVMEKSLQHHPAHITEDAKR